MRFPRPSRHELTDFYRQEWANRDPGDETTDRPALSDREAVAIVQRVAEQVEDREEVRR